MLSVLDVAVFVLAVSVFHPLNVRIKTLVIREF